MTTLAEIKNLKDKEQIESLEATLSKITREEDGKWGKNYNVELTDGQARTFAKLASFKDHDVPSLVGKRLLFKSGRDREGQLISIRVDENKGYKNLYITNSVKIEVIGQGLSSQGASSQSTSQEKASTLSPIQIPPEIMAKHLAEEWVALYGWTAPIFKRVLSDEQLPERVTGILMGLRNRSIYDILPMAPPPALPWRDVPYKDGTLGSLDPVRIKRALVKLYQGTAFSKEVSEALASAAKEEIFSPIACFKQMIEDAGVEDDVANATLLEIWKENYSELKPEEIVQTIGDVEFLELCKKRQAEKASPVDDL